MSEFPDLPLTISRDSLRDLPLSLVITDPSQPDNPIVYVNPAFVRMTGYARSAVYGRNCRFLQGEQTDPDAVEALRTAVANDQEATVDILNYRANGEPFVNRLLIAPVRRDTGDTAYFLGVQTEIRGAAPRVVEAFELSERLREMQHRVKNHLSMIIGMIRMAARQGGSPAETIGVLAGRVEALSLLYDHLTTSDPDGQSDTVNAGAYLSRVASAMQHLADQTRIRVNISTCDVEMAVDDTAQLGLLLSEIMTNAFQHAFGQEDQGLVDVSLVRDGGGLQLTIADTGRGMKHGVWPNRESLGGRIVLDIISKLGASLDVKGEANGTAIAVHLPLTA